MFCFSYDPPELDELERSTTGNATALAIWHFQIQLSQKVMVFLQLTYKMLN